MTGNHILVSLVAFLTSSFASGMTKPLTYCVAVEKIDLNPYRKIVDGKDLAYLLLMRSYISTDPDEPGLLSAYEFSPNGKVFTGRVTEGLKWPDGSTVTPLELAEGIGKAIPYRTLGDRISVKSMQEVDPRTFKIEFKSEIENLTGVVREALSTNSRHNRFWPAKFIKGQNIPMVLGKHTIRGTTLDINGIHIKIGNQSQCKAVDFTIFAEKLDSPPSDFTISKSPVASALTVEVNSTTLNLKERNAVVTSLRTVFANAPLTMGLTPVNSYFLPGEPGFKPDVTWPSETVKECPQRELKVGFEHPLIKSVIESVISKCLNLRLVSLPSTELLDAQIFASGMQEGRHVIFQDILKWPHVKPLLAGAPRTLKALEEIAARSASTLPPDNKILAAFEQTAIQEMALAPLARRHPIAHSRSSSPVRLEFTSKGELTFRVSKP